MGKRWKLCIDLQSRLQWIISLLQECEKKKKSAGDGIVLTSFLVTANWDLRIKSFLQLKLYGRISPLTLARKTKIELKN